MATTKLTNAKTLAILADVAINGTSTTDALAKVEGGFTVDDLAAKVAHMLAQAAKPKTNAKRESKASVRNTAYAAKVADFIVAKGSPVTLAEIMNAGICEYVTKTQGITAVINKGVATGTLVRCGKVNGKLTYGIPGMEPTED